MTDLEAALTSRDLDAILEIIDDDPHQGAQAAGVLEAWAWASASDDAPRFARSLLRTLGASFPAVRVASGDCCAAAKHWKIISSVISGLPTVAIPPGL